VAYQAQYDRALTVVRTLLDTKKHPKPGDIADVPHRYEDKFAMVSHLTNLTIASVWQSLSLLRLTPEILARLLVWSREGQSVRLRFTSEEECHLAKQVVREVESPKVVSETTGGFFGYVYYIFIMYLIVAYLKYCFFSFFSFVYFSFLSFLFLPFPFFLTR
jgi:hypothetical protein